MTQTRHPDGSDLDNRHRFGARARHAGDSPTAVCTADIRALARSLRSGLQARVYQAWICYRKASARGSSEIAARSPGMVVVGTVVASTRGRAFPVIYIQRRRSGMLLFTLQSPRKIIGDQHEGRLWGNPSHPFIAGVSGRSAPLPIPDLPAVLSGRFCLREEGPMGLEAPQLSGY
jgi:hypothetical protein